MKEIYKLCFSLLFLSLLLVMSSTSASAQELLTSPSLKGVNRVALLVYAFGGMDKETIRKLASQELKATNIEVISRTASSRPASVPELNLVVTLACSNGACGYTTRLSLEEPVKLVRQSNSVAKATTWANGYQNAISKEELASLPDLLAVDIRTLVRLFAAEVSGQIQ